MKIEHVAFNVPDPLAMGRWYVEHLGLTVKRRLVEAPYTHFLADDSGTVMLEIYGNKEVAIPDYHSMHVMVLHVAFTTDNIAAEVKRLEAAGGTQDGETITTPQGDEMAFVRDPWGVVLQLIKRASPMI